MSSENLGILERALSEEQDKDALRKLEKINSPEAAAVMARALLANIDDWNFCMRVMLALSEMEQPVAAEPLCDFLEHSLIDVMSKSYNWDSALLNLPEKALDLLRAQISDEDRKSERLAKCLITALVVPDASFRKIVVELLLKIGADHLPMLEQLSETPNETWPYLTDGQPSWNLDHIYDDSCPAPMDALIEIKKKLSAETAVHGISVAKVERDNWFEPEMILIPDGPFLMGSPATDELRWPNEPEQFELNLDYDYSISKYPITIKQYSAFIDAGGYSNRRYWTEAGWNDHDRSRNQPAAWDEYLEIGDDLPVSVSWYEAYAYTCWLTEATGREYKLPTEAEWEKAARGGLEIPDGLGGMAPNPNPARIWPWGDEEPTDELCNFGGNYHGGRLSPVTSHPAQAQKQPYGLYHMAGNSYEWCLSRPAEPYRYPETTDPDGRGIRTARSGCHHPMSNARDVRCSVRVSAFDVNLGGDALGFRVRGEIPVNRPE